MAPFADAVFAYNAQPEHYAGTVDAWIAGLAYSFQLYFDFSGYSDMAIGLGRMFGFRLPTNFNSPYQATSIIDFWRRWHMTLSSFFRDYVYIPLGGNRQGAASQAAFVLTVFFLTGLWHGAGWTFILWGSIHGVLVLVNHVWLKSTARRLPTVLARPLTFVLVVGLWVLFRAPSVWDAAKIARAMTGFGPVHGGIVFIDRTMYPVALLLIAAVAIIAFTMPNSMTLAHRLRHGRLRASANRLRSRWWLPAMVTGLALYVAIASIGSVESKFIYFNF